MSLLRPERADIQREDFTIVFGPDLKEQAAYEAYSRWCVACGYPVGALDTWLRTNRGIADNWYRLRER